MQETFDKQGKILLLNIRDCRFRIYVFFLIKRLQSENNNNKKICILHLSCFTFIYICLAIPLLPGNIRKVPPGQLSFTLVSARKQENLLFHLFCMVLQVLNDSS